MFTKAVKFLFGSLIIKIMLLSNIFLFLINIQEISTNYSFNKNKVSYWYAVTTFITCFWVLLLSIFKWWSIRIIDTEDKIDTLKFTKEFFNGLKSYTPARFYIIFWIFRRLYFVGGIILMERRSKYEVLSGIWVLQILYTGYLWIFKPFSKIKDNLWEINNEIFILIALILW